jgi:hypothetical protein
MMATRISPPAPAGSLLKGQQPQPSKRDKSPRQHSDGHLAAIRKLPCLNCGQEHAIEAAHIRQSAPGKPLTGMGLKPDDRYTVPLCHDCHMTQHRVGEKPFFAKLGIDPLKVASDLFEVSPDIAKMTLVVLTSQQK